MINDKIFINMIGNCIQLGIKFIDRNKTNINIASQLTFLIVFIKFLYYNYKVFLYLIMFTP